MLKPVGADTAIVVHAEKKTFVFFPTGNIYLDGFILADTMGGGIFNNRLQDKAGNQHVCAGIHNMAAEAAGAAIAPAHDFDIILKIVNLIFCLPKLSVGFENWFQKASQSSNAFGNVVRIFHYGHPFNGIQGIVDKMRI